MTLNIKLYEKEHIPLVKAFNKRLLDKGDQHRFPESNIPSWLPKRPGSNLYQEYYVIGDEESVRGGCIIKYQDFLLKGNKIQISNMQLPISEGIIDPNYTLIGPVIARNTLEKAPILYSLGMGGYSEPITRLLQALRWKLFSVPFYFKVININNFLRKNTYLRDSSFKRIMLDICAYSGMGSISIHILQFIRQRRLPGDHLITEEVSEGDEDIDTIWEKAKDHYTLIAVRDSQTIDILYPICEKRFQRTKVYAHGKCIGWVVTLCTQMTSHKQFGSLRVGSIIDCLSHPDDADTIVKVAASGLEALGADIIVANHSHRVWGRAFGRNGFLRGPSNFIFGASVALARLLGEFDAASKEIFFMRGDGDGPINL